MARNPAPPIGGNAFPLVRLSAYAAGLVFVLYALLALAA